MIENKNYMHNKNIKLWNGYINGQGCGNVANMRYGLFPMSFNGCEIIALYNFMYSIGRKMELKDVAREAYPYASVLMGIFGSAPKKIGRFLDDHGIEYKRASDFDEFVNNFEKSESALIAFWVKLKSGFYGIHTVFIRNIDGKFRVYNRSNGNPRPVDYDKMSDFLKNPKHLIVSFCCGDKL